LQTLVLAEPSQCHSRVIPMRYCPSIITAPDWRKKLIEWIKCSYCCYLTQQSSNVDCDSVVQSTWSAARGYPLLHSCWHLVCRVHYWWVFLSFNQMALRASLQSLFCFLRPLKPKSKLCIVWNQNISSQLNEKMGILLDGQLNLYASSLCLLGTLSFSSCFISSGLSLIEHALLYAWILNLVVWVWEIFRFKKSTLPKYLGNSKHSYL
jgi:hypothetical protein